MTLFSIGATCQRAFHQFPFAVAFILWRKEFGIVGVKAPRDRIDKRSLACGKQVVYVREFRQLCKVIGVPIPIAVYIIPRIARFFGSRRFAQFVAADFAADPLFHEAG